MTPSQAILAGSAFIAVSIVAAAIVLPEGQTPFGKKTGIAQAPAPAKPAARYQIVKADDRMTWRLDTETGDITVCRLEKDRMVCANSADATILPKVSSEDLRKQEAERRAEKKAERNEVLDRFMAFFERIIRLGKEQAGDDKPATPDDGNALKL